MFCSHTSAAAVIRCDICNKYLSPVSVIIISTNINNCVTSNINVQFLTNSSACIAFLTNAETPTNNNSVKGFSCLKY